MQKYGSNISIDQAHPDETEALLSLYIDFFYDREPLTKCLGLSKERMISFALSMYGGANSNPVSQGFCWVARDGSAADKEVGFIVCDDPVTEGNQQVPEDISDSECTSMGSRRCHEKLGFHCLHSVAAGDVSVDGVRPFSQSKLDIHLLWKDLAKGAA